MTGQIIGVDMTSIMSYQRIIGGTMPVDPTAAQDWIRKRQSLIDRIFGGLLYRWHQKMPSVDLATLSLGRALLYLAYGFTLLAIAGFPTVEQWRRTGEIAQNHALLSAGILGALLFLSGTISSQLNQKRDSEKWSEIEVRLAGYLSKVLLGFNGHTKILPTAVAKEKRRSSLGPLLKCVEYRISQIVNRDAEEYFSVTLLLFKETGGRESIEILARSSNAPDRPTNVARDANDSIAYHVAKVGSRCFAVHDFSRNRIFPFERLSASATPPYRSILIVSLPFEDIGGFSRCRGALTIDSSQPYEFYSLEYQQVITLLFPFTQVVNLLVSDLTQGIEVRR